jgi:hypothetical protein
VFEWRAVRPDDSIKIGFSLTYDFDTNCWLRANGSVFLCNGTSSFGHINVFTTVRNSCDELLGNWTFQFVDAGVVQLSSPFTLAHSTNSLLGITQPMQENPMGLSYGNVAALFGLTEQNYTETPQVAFSAVSNTGGAIDWTVTLDYNTSGIKLLSSLFDFLSFQTASGGAHTETYQSMGGKVKAEATTTAPDGSTVRDCVTFYVEGPEAGIPGPGPGDVITPRLIERYASLMSPVTPATYNLMTGIAMKESGYTQFRTPPEGNPDLWNLTDKYGIPAKWPTESFDGGSHIGLMMVEVSALRAWDWLVNTQDGVNLFVNEKLPTATSNMNRIIDGSPKDKVKAHPGLLPLTGVQLENMALVLYGPFAPAQNLSLATKLTMQYYAPVCAGTVTSKGICQGAGGWVWAVNDPSISPLVPPPGNPEGVNYVIGTQPPSPGVRNQLQ